MKWTGVVVSAALLLRMGLGPCVAQESVLGPRRQAIGQRMSAIGLVAEPLRVARSGTILLAPGPTEADPNREAGGRRVASQFAGGIFLSGVAETAAFGIAAALPIDDSNSRLDAGEIMLLLGTPLAFLVANSAAVYHIGRHFDKEAHGSYRSTFLGVLSGFLIGGGTAVFLGNATQVDTKGWVVGITAAWASSTLGSIVGYNLSRPDASAVLHVEDGHVRPGVPVPKLNLSARPDGPAGVRYTLPLLNARF